MAPSGGLSPSITMAGIRPMRNEFDDFRRSSDQPYLPDGRVLVVPANAVVATSNLLRRAGKLEACVFWYGTRAEGEATVKAVRAPHQTATRFNYHVDEVAMSLMCQTLAPEWRPLAQIHSHPGPSVEHSPYDDTMVSSKRALSLVFPNYGNIGGLWPCGIGVHEWQSEYWHLLTPDQAIARVQLAGETPISIEDLR